jgi:hypothetical protein
MSNQRLIKALMVPPVNYYSAIRFSLFLLRMLIGLFYVRIFHVPKSGQPEAALPPYLSVTKSCGDAV